MKHRVYLRYYKSLLILVIEHYNDKVLYTSNICLEHYYKQARGLYFNHYRLNDNTYIQTPTITNVITAVKQYKGTIKDSDVIQAINDLMHILVDYFIKFPKRDSIKPFIRYYNALQRQEQN